MKNAEHTNSLFGQMQLSVHNYVLDCYQFFFIGLAYHRLVSKHNTNWMSTMPPVAHIHSNPP
jgi:hypothetical protein